MAEIEAEVNFVVELPGSDCAYPIHWDLTDKQIESYGSVIDGVADWFDDESFGSLYANLMYFMGYPVKDVKSRLDDEGNIDLKSEPDDGATEVNNSRIYISIETEDLDMEIPLTDYMPADEVKAFAPKLLASVQFGIVSPVCEFSAMAKHGKFSEWPDDEYENLRSGIIGVSAPWRDRFSMPWLEFAAYCAFVLDMYDNDLEAGLYGTYGESILTRANNRPAINIDALIAMLKKKGNG